MRWDMLGQYREIRNSWIWENAEYWKWWSDLVFMAKYSDAEGEIERGELIASRRFLAKRWGSTEQKVRSFIAKLLKDSCISIRFIDKKSVIKITNFGEKNQPDSNPIATQQTTQQTTRQTVCNTDSCVNNQPDQQPDQQPEVEPEVNPNIYININNNIDNKLSMSTELTSPAKKREEIFNWKNFLEFFNDVMKNSCISKIKVITPARKKAVLARYKEMESQFKGHGKEKIAFALRIAANDNFLNGKVNGWIATFDNIFTPKIFATLIEGGYRRNIPTTEKSVVNTNKKTTAFDALRNLFPEKQNEDEYIETTTDANAEIIR